MNKKLKAKLFIGIFLISGIIAKTSTFSMICATCNKFESPSASEGIGNDDDTSTLPYEPTGNVVAIHTLDPVFNIIQQSFSSAVENGDIETMLAYLEHTQEYGILYTPQLNWLENSWTLLHVAAVKNNAEEILRTLFFNGTPIEAAARNLINNQDRYGRTPLHWAAIKHNYDAYNFLVQQGADRTILDHNGHIPDEYFARPLQYEEIF